MMKCKEIQNQNARRRSYFVWCTKNITHKSLVVPFEQPKWYIFRGRIALRTQTLVTRDLCSFACVHTHTRDWCVGFACLLVFFSLLLFSLQAIWCYKYSNVVHFKRFRTNRFSFLSFLATHWFRTIRNLMKIKKYKRQRRTPNAHFRWACRLYAYIHTVLLLRTHSVARIVSPSLFSRIKMLHTRSHSPHNSTQTINFNFKTLFLTEIWSVYV